MVPSPSSVVQLAPERGRGLRPRHLRRLHVEMVDGARTTVHVASYDLARIDVQAAQVTRA